MSEFTLSEKARQQIERPHYWRDVRDMMASDAGAEFEEALFELQSDLDAIIEADSHNPFHKNSFASLPHTLKTVRDLCKEHGFTIRQFPGALRGHGSETKRFYTLPVCTKITHKDTQQAEMIIVDIPVDNTATSYGAALTFGKRYALQSYFGIASADSDAMTFIQNKLDQETAEELATGLIEQIKETDTVKALEGWIKKSDASLKMYSEAVLALVRKAYAEHKRALEAAEKKAKSNGKGKNPDDEALNAVPHEAANGS